MTVAIIVVIAFYFILFVLGYVFGRMDKKSNQAPMKPLEVKYTRYDLKQWAARQVVDAEEFKRMDSQVIERYVAGIIADKFKAVIQDHMTAEKDYCKRKVIYSIDIWLRKDN